MIAKLGAILLTCVLSEDQAFSEDDVDATSLLSMRGVVQTRPTCLPAGSKQVYHQIEGECREVILGTDADNEGTSGATCPSGYMAILTEDECHAACDVLDHRHKWRPVTTNNNQPNGCFTVPTLRVVGDCHFNINNEGGFIRHWKWGSRSMCMKQTQVTEG